MKAKIHNGEDMARMGPFDVAYNNHRHPEDREIYVFVQLPDSQDPPSIMIRINSRGLVSMEPWFGVLPYDKDRVPDYPRQSDEVTLRYETDTED